MGTITGQGIEAITVRRAVIADADKVRYRVYRGPDDFIAVIAESALMAMKVAGVSEPFRIVRDLPSEQVALQADRLAKIEVPQKVAFALQSAPRASEALEMAVPNPIDFIPMQLRDLEQNKKKRTRVLSPEEMAAMMQALMPEPMPQPAPKPMVVPTPAPVVEEPPPPVVTAEPALPEPEPEPVQMAAPEPAAPDGERALTPEEVARLLGE